MKDAEAKFKFIQLRVKGESFDSIARELNKSKSTLINWSLELKKEIQNMEFEQYQSLLEQFKLTQKVKIEFLAELLNKTRQAINTIDLSQIPFKDLLLLNEKCETSLKDELSQILFHTGEYTKGFYDGMENELNGHFEITEKLV